MPRHAVIETIDHFHGQQLANAATVCTQFDWWPFEKLGHLEAWLMLSPRVAAALAASYWCTSSTPQGDGVLWLYVAAELVVVGVVGVG